MNVASKKNTELIVETAVELFRKNGYSNVSVNEICKAAGLSRSSFYTVFSSKKEIVNYVLSTVENDLSTTLSAFIGAENDFERMWSLCDRYLGIALKFGSELTGSLLALELEESIGMTDYVHSTDNWFITLTKTCQKSGIIRNKTRAEALAPIATSLVYQTVYDWCRLGGSFDLRKQVRHNVEIIYDIADKYRWSD